MHCGHLTAEIAEFLKIQPTWPLVDFVADQCDRHLDSRTGLLAEHLKDVTVREPSDRRHDFGLGGLQAIDDYLVDV